MSDDENQARGGLGVFAGPDGAVGGAIAEPSMVENEDDTDDSGAAELGETSRRERSAFHDAWDVSLGDTAASDLELPNDVLQQFREIDNINQLVSKKTSRHPQKLRDGYTAHKRYFKDLIDPEDPMFGQLRVAEGAFLKASLQFDPIVKDPFDLVSFVELVTNPLLRANYDTATVNVKQLIAQDVVQEQILFYQDELSQDKLDIILRDGFQQEEANRGIPFAKSVDTSKNDVLLLCRCLHNFGPTDTDLVQKFDDANLILPFCVIHLRASQNIGAPPARPIDSEETATAAAPSDQSGSLEPRLFVVKDDAQDSGDMIEGLEDVKSRVVNLDPMVHEEEEDGNVGGGSSGGSVQHSVASLIKFYQGSMKESKDESKLRSPKVESLVRNYRRQLSSLRKRLAAMEAESEAVPPTKKLKEEDIDIVDIDSDDDELPELVDDLIKPRLSVTAGKDPRPERPSWLRQSSSSFERRERMLFQPSSSLEERRQRNVRSARERLQHFQDRIITTMDRQFLTSWLRRVVTSLRSDRNASIVVLAQLVRDGQASDFEMQKIAETLREQEDYNCPLYVKELKSVASFGQLKNLLEDLAKKDVNVLLLHGSDQRLMLLWRVQMMLKELEESQRSVGYERLWPIERMLIDLEDQYSQHAAGDVAKKEEAKDDPNA